MATIAYSVAETPAQSYRITWSGLAAGDTGASVDFVGHADRTVQIVGTFGGATVVLEGSLDGTNWATLNDAQGDPISLTAAGIAAVTEMVLYTRPRVAGGAGVSVTVLLMMRRTMG